VYVCVLSVLSCVKLRHVVTAMIVVHRNSKKFHSKQLDNNIRSKGEQNRIHDGSG
jgi:hypothetical protein